MKATSLVTAIVLTALPAFAIAVLPQASAAEGPSPEAGAERIESFRPNLDKDRRRERVFVYNLVTEGSPASYFEVWNRESGNWSRAQLELVSQTPSLDPSSGLVDAWLKDLNRDGRDEIAVRDFVTPSVGEVLSIFRQKSKHSLRFSVLQTVGGDQVTVQTKKGETATLAVLLKSNHSADGLEHHESWSWSQNAHQWECTVDCGGRPARRGRGGSGTDSVALKIIPQVGIAGAKLGMTQNRVRAKLGAPDRERIRTSPIGGFDYVELKYGRTKISFDGVEASSQVLGIITKDPNERTDSGVGVGSTRSEVEAGVPDVTCAREFGINHCYVGEFVPGQIVTDFTLKSRKHEQPQVVRVGVGRVLD